MAVRHSRAVQRLSSATRQAESRLGRIGPISLDMKQMGERSAGNPHAAFDVEGAGNVARHRPKPARQSSTLPVRGAPSNERPYRNPVAGWSLIGAGNWRMGILTPNPRQETEITGSLPHFLMRGLPRILPSQPPRPPEQGEARSPSSSARRLQFAGRPCGPGDPTGSSNS